MEKAFLIFLGLLALGHAASLYADVDATTADPSVDPVTTGPPKTTVVPDPTVPNPVVTTTVAPNPTVPNPVVTTTVVPEASVAPPPPGKCVYPTQAWGVPDLRKLAFCLDGQERITECNEDEYYLSNDEISGCVPADEMSANCVNLDVTVGPCTGNNLKQPQPSVTLTNFWFCEKEGEQPVECTCEKGKAFLKQDGYMGCFEWSQWRQVRGCKTYTNSP